MANRNRTAGHNYERQVVNEFKEMGFDTTVTARAESRNLDNLGIDVFDTDELMPHDIQCKVSKGFTSKQIRELLDRGRDKKPLVILHKHVEKSGVKFMPKGEYVYIKKETYYKMIEDNKNC
jgi:Holliday junction resolvase